MSKIARTIPTFLVFGLLGALLRISMGVEVPAADKNAGGQEQHTTARFHVVGYLPDYRAANIDPDVGKYLTDLVYFSAVPDPSGGVNFDSVKPESIQMLRKMKQRHHIAILVCIGGWERSAGFPQLAASSKARQRFVAAATRFCIDNDFDGIDIDWEHPADETQQRDYAALLAALKQGFEPHHLQLTMAVAGWQDLPAGAFQSVDRIHLMAYDSEGRHSTYEFAQADVQRLAQRGAPLDKICLGIPFYGRGVKDRSQELSYAQIVNKFRPATEVDEVDGIYFNGVKTVETKTRFALTSKIAGVMAWEIGQDTRDDSSLLRAIRKVADDLRADK